MAKSNNYLYIAVIIVLAAGLAYFFGRDALLTSEQQPAVDSVKSVFSALSESPADILAVKEESGLYRITVKTTLQNGQPSVQDVYVTKDGALIAGNVINVTAYSDLLARQKNFTQCLADSKVVIAGLSTDANTVTQLQTLGNFAYKIYVDCGGANQQLCQNAGIKNVPTTIIGNQSVEGVQPISFYETATGCTY